MRGFSISERIFPFAERIILSFHKDSKVITRDLITIKEVLGIVEDLTEFDIWVIQVGVADSLSTNFRRRHDVKYPAEYRAERPKFIKRIFKRVLLMLRLVKARTSPRDYFSHIEFISKLAKSRGVKVVWLGSVVGAIRLTNPERIRKRDFCKNYFLEIVKRFPETNIFMDVEDACSNFVEESDIFHLNQAGHNAVSDYLKSILTRV